MKLETYSQDHKNEDESNPFSNSYSQQLDFDDLEQNILVRVLVMTAQSFASESGLAEEVRNNLIFAECPEW